jgi:hypothetical protein
MVYSYKCEKCGTVFVHHSSVQYRNNPQKCFCGGIGKRDMASELKDKGRFNALTKDNERWSTAMGVLPEKIPEAMRQFPDRTYHPETGDLLVRNRQHKKKLMKENKVQELA